ncbi:MAG: hypothetical protein ACI4I6_00655 [Hominimerdicola sp.]
MKKSWIFLIIGILMLIVAIVFVCYSLSHPESSWNLPLNVVYTIYFLYFVANVTCFIIFGIARHEENSKND